MPTARPHRPRRARRGARTVLVTLLAAVLAALALPAPPVSAHAGLDASVPAPSSVLEEAPAAIVLDFDEPIEGGLSSIELFDQDERRVEIGDAVNNPADDSVVTADLPPLDDGIYAVVWRVASADGHIVTGAFGFSIGTVGDAGDLLAQVRDGVQADRSVRVAADIARFVLYVGLVLLVGAGVWGTLLADHLTGWRRRLPAVGWVLAVLGAAAGFGLYGATAVAGSLADAVSPDVWGRIDGTQTGRMALVRLGLLAALGVLLWKRRASHTMWWRQTAVAAAVGTLITLPAAGHPSSTSPRALFVLLDALHLLGIVVWIGGLAVFAIARRSWFDHPAVAHTARTFSRTATVAVPVVVVTGTWQGVELAGGVEGLTDTGWGRTLLVKLAVVSVVVAIGGVSRWLLHQVGPASIHRTVMAEAVLATVVLGLTASLVALPPRPSNEGEVFNATLAQAGLIVDITVTPGRVGANEVHLVLTPPGGSIQPVVGVEARMSLPAEEIPASPVALDADGPDHFTGSITLPFAGDWTLELIVEVTPGNTALLSTTVPIP